jgi:hypothetical protein
MGCLLVLGWTHQETAHSICVSAYCPVGFELIALAELQGQAAAGPVEVLGQVVEVYSKMMTGSPGVPRNLLEHLVLLGQSHFSSAFLRCYFVIILAQEPLSSHTPTLSPPL